MDPATLAALIGAASSAIQAISGISQKNKAANLETEYPRPEAKQSPLIKELLALAKGKTMDQDIPGGNIYRDEIKGATSEGIRAASELGSGAEAYGMLHKLISGEQKSFTNLAAMTKDRVAGAEANYMNILAGPAYQDERRVDYWNKEMPYMQAAQAAQQLNQSGGMNQMSAVKNIAGIASALLTGGSTPSGGYTMTDEQLNKILSNISNPNN